MGCVTGQMKGCSNCKKPFPFPEVRLRKPRNRLPGSAELTITRVSNPLRLAFTTNPDLILHLSSIPNTALNINLSQSIPKTIPRELDEGLTTSKELEMIYEFPSQRSMSSCPRILGKYLANVCAMLPIAE